MKFIQKENNDFPMIEYENGTFQIKGKSIPFNKNLFDNYLKSLSNKINNFLDKDIVINIDLEYTNAYTKKKLVEFINYLEFLSNKSKNIKINWYCNKENENMIELGQMLKNLTSLDFQIFIK